MKRKVGKIKYKNEENVYIENLLQLLENKDKKGQNNKKVY